MKKNVWVITTVVIFLMNNCCLFAQDGPVGWAAYNALQQNGTTGGGNGPIVRVTTKAELEKYASAQQPYIIFVEGMFSGPAMVNVENDKSIIGVGNGAIFNRIGFDIRGKRNIIFRNVTIQNAKPDAIAVRNSHHIWIDHCDLSTSDDGLIDFTIGSDYLTVSWCKLHDHDKVALANGGSRDFSDVGKNKITYHHNWFCNTVQRNPRIGYGMGHIFNNYYENISSYCIGYHTGASILIENNYFYKSSKPLQQMYTSVPTAANYANAKERGNIFDNTSGNTKGTGLSFEPTFYYDYAFALDSAIDLPHIIKSFSGPRPGIEHEIIPTPANGAIDVYKIGELSWSNSESSTSFDVHFGTNPDSLTKSSTIKRIFSLDNLHPNTEYFWKINAVKSDTVIRGSLWRFRTASVKNSKPYPAAGELHVNLRQIEADSTCVPLQLSWTPGFQSVKYKVYLGESYPLKESDFKEEVTSPKFASGPLKYGVQYFWRVNTVASDGSVNEGDTWDFTSDVSYSKEGNTEAEDMILNGRAFVETQNGDWFLASNEKVVSGEAGPGTISSIWAGGEAKCKIVISYFDESDGKGSFGFFVNEKQIDKWLASNDNDALNQHVINNVTLHKGDEIRIEFCTDLGELNRIDLMNIEILK